MLRKASSNPELGKNNPSLSQETCALQPFGNVEIEAERLFYALFTVSISKSEVCILSKDLTRRDAVAGAYLFWLVERHFGDQWGGERWPKVAPQRKKTKMHLLKLFKGTGSIGRACQERGWEVTSVDWHKK